MLVLKGLWVMLVPYRDIELFLSQLLDLVYFRLDAVIERVVSSMEIS